MITNQSGIMSGLYHQADLDRLHTHLAAVLAVETARIDAFYDAPYHPAGSVADFAIEHEDRKPGARMNCGAMADWPIQARGSFLIGDKPSDAAEAAAGLPSLLIEPNTGDLLMAAREMSARHRID